jgi:hypothetical protein
MLRRHRRSAAMLMLFGFATVACRDVSTGPDEAALLARADAVAPAAAVFGRDRGGGPGHVCWVSRRTPGGPYRYRYTRLTLRFPDRAVAPDGATRTFRYKLQGAGGETLLAASCRIPRTPEALEIMHDRFFYDRRRAPAYDGDVVIQSCPIGTVCLEPVTGTAPGGWYPGGGGGGGSYYCGTSASAGDCYEGDDGGGDDWDPGTPEDTPTGEPVADDEAVDCIDLGCKLRDPTEAERQRVLELIDQWRSDGFCAEVRASALEMVNRGLQVWDNRVYALNDSGKPATLLGAAPWDYDLGGPVMYLWTGSLTGWTIAHEAIHGIWNPAGLGHYYTHSDITPLGMNLDQTAKYCSRS